MRQKDLESLKEEGLRQQGGEGSGRGTAFFGRREGGEAGPWKGRVAGLRWGEMISIWNT